MVGGMIPPLAIATMIFFKRKFTKEQRGSIVPNYVMGLSFITEGAIPFAAPITCDPINDGRFRCRWCNCISIRFKNQCTTRWYHCYSATDFSHILQTLIALIVGTLVSAIMYGLLKPKVTKTKLKLQKLWMNRNKNLLP